MKKWLAVQAILNRLIQLLGHKGRVVPVPCWSTAFSVVFLMVTRWLPVVYRTVCFLMQTGERFKACSHLLCENKPVRVLWQSFSSFSGSHAYCLLLSHSLARGGITLNQWFSALSELGREGASGT